MELEYQTLHLIGLLIWKIFNNILLYTTSIVYNSAVIPRDTQLDSVWRWGNRVDFTNLGFFLDVIYFTKTATSSSWTRAFSGPKSILL